MEIRRVAAGRGVDWWVEGYAIFRANPVLWIVNVTLFGVLSVLISAVPFVGPLVSTVLQPVLLAGLLQGCRDLEGGGSLRVDHLFAGFRDHTRPLLILGLILGFASFAVALIMFTPIAAMMGLGYFGSAMMETPEWPDGIPEDLDPALVWVILVVFALAALLAVPVAMAGWFAPALVILRNVGVVDALKASFVGCLRNGWPLSVYGLLLIVLGLVALIPFGLGLLVLLPTLLGSLYAGFRDIFRADDQAPAGAQG
jgi:uncharacterized membrane protein